MAGQLIGFFGIPSSGKSSTAKELAKAIGGEVFFEPEESDWPELISKRELYGNFTALTWFRSVRVQMLINADLARKTGKAAVIDSMYDVLLRYYIEDPSFRWLVPEHDPHFKTAILMAEIDRETLPKIDQLVFLDLEESTWIKMMSVRNREFDSSANLKSHFAMQAVMKIACEAYAKEYDVRLIVHKQKWSTPRETASQISNKIQL